MFVYHPEAMSRPLITFFRLLAGLALSAALAGCGPQKPLSVASHVWPGYEPMFLARNQGWLDRDKVVLAETASATESLRALAEGRVDGAALTLDEVLRSRSEGVPLTVVAIFDISAGADVLLARPEIPSLAALKGKRLGYEPSGTGHLMAVEALRQAGLAEADVRTVPLEAEEHLRAWQENRVDALVTYEPTASQLRRLKARRLFDSRDIPNTIVDVLVVRRDRLAEGRGEALRHLLAAHFRALAHIERNPQDAAYRLAPRLGLPPGEALAAFRGLLLPDAANNARLLRGNPPPLAMTASRLLALARERQLLTSADNLERLVDASYLPVAGP